MSAWIVTKKHIDYILSTYKDSGDTLDRMTDDKLTTIGQALWNENYKSVNYRYNEEETPPVYQFTYIGYTTIPQTFMLLHCLTYQSCEHPDYEDSHAKELINEILYDLSYKVAETANAQWTID